MKFLVAIPYEGGEAEEWTTEREAVVPCFPSQGCNKFLAIPSFKMAVKAEVANIDADPDALVEKLIKEYPSLPRTLHENYILKVFMAINEVPLGTVFNVLVNQQQALLTNKTTTITLWDKQPVE